MSFSIQFSTGLLLATCLTLNACSDNSSETINDSLTFVPCEITQELDCGAFEVPLIHDSTDSRRISIDVARLPGIGDGPHEPLIINFGGPGSGIGILQEIVEFDVLPTAIREGYDIIGFDQRGVGDPLRLDCDDLGATESILYPRNPGEVQTMVDSATLLADACFAEYSDSLQHVGSNAVVQDLEIMRTLLGAPKLHMIGISFGTRITALYLERFPDTTGRIILDAPLRPNGNLDSLLMDTATAQQQSFEQMLSACGSSLPDCDRATVEAAFVARVNSLLDTDDQETLEAFFLLLTIGIEEIDNGEFLAPLLIDFAFTGDPADMFALIQEFGLDDEDEENDNTDENDSITLEIAVLCADDEARPTNDSLINTLGQLNDNADLFAEAVLPLAATCAGWPDALDPMTDIRSTEAPPSLVIGGQQDVNTPISWAKETAEALGGEFLSSDHLGHTTVFIRNNDCVDSIVVDFLIDGTLPPARTVCE